MFVMTQMHGLGLSKKTLWVLGLAYALSMLFIYSQTSGILNVYKAALIPLVELLLVVIVSGLVWWRSSPAIRTACCIGSAIMSDALQLEPVLESCRTRWHDTQLHRPLQTLGTQ